MPSRNCLCGHRISPGSFSNEGAYLLTSEHRYDQIDDTVDQQSLAPLCVHSERVLKCFRCRVTV
jgi:hypothetical protein